MQDRYAGDVGDFGKLGMLRQIADTGLKVGILHISRKNALVKMANMLDILMTGHSRGVMMNY